MERTQAAADEGGRRLEMRVAGCDRRASAHPERLVLALGHLELTNILDALIVLDAPVAIRGVLVGDSLPEGLIEVLRAHLVRVDRAVLALVQLSAVVALRHLEAEECVVFTTHAVHLRGGGRGGK